MEKRAEAMQGDGPRKRQRGDSGEPYFKGTLALPLFRNLFHPHHAKFRHSPRLVWVTRASVLMRLRRIREGFLQKVV